MQRRFSASPFPFSTAPSNVARGPFASSASVDTWVLPGPSYAVMNDYTETGANPGRDPAAWLTMREAGEQLGMTPNAIRQRIRRGSMTALKVDGIWRVQLPARVRPGPTRAPYDRGADQEDTTAPTTGGPTDPSTIEARFRVTPAEIEQAIERTGDKYLADMQAMLAPLVARIGELEREAGRLTAERNQAHEKIDALQGRLSQLETQLAHPPAPAVESAASRRLVEIVTLEREQVEAERDALERRLRELEDVKDTSPAQDASAPETAVRRVWWRFWERRG